MTSDTSTTIEDGPFSFSIHLYPGKHVECSCRKLQTRVALHEVEYSRDQFNKYFWLLLLLERSARLNNFLIPGCRSLLQSVYVSHYHLHYHHLCHSQSRTMLNFGFNYRNHHPTPIWMGNLYLCTLWLFLSLQHILSRRLWTPSATMFSKQNQLHKNAAPSFPTLSSHNKKNLILFLDWIWIKN